MLNQGEVMQNSIKQRLVGKTDEEKSKQYAKILQELAVGHHYYLVTRGIQEVSTRVIHSFHQHI